MIGLGSLKGLLKESEAIDNNECRKISNRQNIWFQNIPITYFFDDTSVTSDNVKKNTFVQSKP